MKIFIFRALEAFKGPIRSSDQIFTYFNASAVSRPTKPEIFMSLSLSVLSQSGPPKSVGGGSGVVGGGGGGGGGGKGRIPHFNWSIYRGGNFFSFFFFLFFWTRAKIGREID